MKKIFLLVFSINLLFGALEDYNVGTWNLQGSLAATENNMEY